MVRFDAGLKKKYVIWVFSSPKLVFKQVLGVSGLWNVTKLQCYKVTMLQWYTNYTRQFFSSSFGYYNVTHVTQKVQIPLKK